MNQQEILRKIGGIINELKEQHTYLEANDSVFNDLELELFMANANFLTDHIQILKKIHDQAKQAAHTPLTVFTTEKIPPTKPVIADYFSEKEHLPFADDPLLKKLNDIPSKESAEQFFEIEAGQDGNSILLLEPKDETPVPFIIADTSFTAQKLVPTGKEKVENTFAEARFEPVKTIETELETKQYQESEIVESVFEEEAKPEPAKPEPIPQAFIKPEPVKPELGPVLTLNERIAAQNGIAQPSSKAVVGGKSNQDLPALINLNDKLLFVKELFNGYNLAYAEAINILNRYTNFNQAEQFLKTNYAEKNNWKDKPATAERFYDLLRKRFPLEI